MKIIVIGLGSMGKRRIRILKENEYFKDIELIGVDTNNQRREEAKSLFLIKCYSSIEEVVQTNRPNASIVCTSPISHGEIIKELLKNKIHVFTEINLLWDYYEEVMEMAKINHLHLFLSSTMLYRKEIEYIINSVKNCKGGVFYRYHSGQYLPDWHPWENYKDFFVFNPITNGCREVFGIELPWIMSCFGEIDKINVLKEKISDLEINYNDSYIVTIEHSNGNKGVLNFDVISRIPTREFEVYSDKIHIKWNGTPEGVLNFNINSNQIEKINLYNDVHKDSKYADSIIENAYFDELKTFIDIINGKKISPRYTFSDDLRVLKIIDQIEGV